MTMSCCCSPVDDSEHILLNDRKRDDNANERGFNEIQDDEYQELSGSASNEKPESERNLYGGYAFALLGVVTISAGLACTQALDQSVQHSELNGLRFVAQLIIITPLLIGFKKCDIRVERSSIIWLVLGTVLLTANSYVNYGAAYYLPLGVSSGISRSLVLIFTYVISSITNKRVWWYEFTAVIMCLTGVIMVTQPPFIFHETGSSILSQSLGENGTFQSVCGIVTKETLNLYTNISRNDTLETGDTKEDRQTTIGYILCVTSAIISTCYIQVVKKKLSSLNIFIYNFWACLFGIGSSFSIMAATETPYFPTLPICVAFLIIHLVSAGSHAIFVYRAFQLLDPVISSLILTLQIVVTFVLQYTLLSGIHPGHANAAEISGAVLIFVGNILVPGYQFIQLTRKKTDVKTSSDVR